MKARGAGEDGMRICVFCGSSPGGHAFYAEHAASFGRLLAARGIGLVYGGAQVGTMGVLANAALDAGGQVIGVIPQAMVEREIAHRGLTELRIVSSMHERKALMAELADAFVALPGGIGTLEELFEVWTWGQLGLHTKPCGALNVRGFYDRLAAFLDHTVAEGFLRPQHRAALLVESEAEGLLTAIARYHAAPVTKWLGHEQT
jgi:uncharacterized protein (TIGR00730 family)